MGPGTASGVRRADARAVLRPRAAERAEGRALGAAGSAGRGERPSARVAEAFRALRLSVLDPVRPRDKGGVVGSPPTEPDVSPSYTMALSPSEVERYRLMVADAVAHEREAWVAAGV